MPMESIVWAIVSAGLQMISLLIFFAIATETLIASLFSSSLIPSPSKSAMFQRVFEAII